MILLPVSDLCCIAGSCNNTVYVACDVSHLATRPAVARTRTFNALPGESLSDSGIEAHV